MKKWICALMAGALMLSVAACGKEEVKNAGKATMEQNGTTVTMSFDAKGDIVTKITQESVIDLSVYPEEAVAALDEAIAEAEATYAALEGVQYTCETTDQQMTETIVIPTDEDTLKAVVNQGLLPVEGENVTAISLEDTLDSLESSGWTVERAE